MDGETAETPNLFPSTVGERLRAAREAQKLDLSEIASRTRIPQRHLEAVEQSNFTSLPSVTYAYGFAKAYARAVGADEVAIGHDLRKELGDAPERVLSVPTTYDLDDAAARVPPRGLAWGGAIVAILVLIGVGLWYGTDLFRGGAPQTENAAPVENATAGVDNVAAAAPTPAVAGGQVTLVALDTVWVRITDASGKRLFEKEMAAGERYDVPADADRPRARTGRPDRLQVLINGSNVSPLGTAVETVEVEVSAAALQARGQPAATPAASAPAASGPAASGPTRRSAPRATPQPAAPVINSAAPGEATGSNTTAIP